MWLEVDLVWLTVPFDDLDVKLQRRAGRDRHLPTPQHSTISRAVGVGTQPSPAGRGRSSASGGAHLRVGRGAIVLVRIVRVDPADTPDNTKS